MNTTTEKIKALRDALKSSRLYISGEALPTKKQALDTIESALALTADASEDAPDVAGMLRDKLDAVFKNVASLIEQHTGKPCGPEPLDDLAAILAARPAPVGAGMAVGPLVGCGDGNTRVVLGPAVIRESRTTQEIRAVAPAAPVAAEDASVLDHQVARWRKEVARLQDLIATAEPAASTPLCPARNTECGTVPQQWCATCPEWEKARSSPMAAPFDEQKLLQLFSTWECLQRGEKGKAAWEAIIAHIKDFRGGAATADTGGAKLAEVIAFLNGEGPLDGMNFGDSDTARPRARYWWRKHLMAAWRAKPAEQAKPEAVEQAGGTYCLSCRGEGSNSSEITCNACRGSGIERASATHKGEENG